MDPRKNVVCMGTDSVNAKIVIFDQLRSNLLELMPMGYLF